MDWPEVTRIAMRALARNKLRTALTLLGITIGISAVICTVAIGQGGSNQIREQLQTLGENLVWVEAGGRSVSGVRTGTGATKTLTVADMNAMLQQTPLLKRCSPQVDARIQVVYGNQNWNATYRGSSRAHHRRSQVRSSGTQIRESLWPCTHTFSAMHTGKPSRN